MDYYDEQEARAEAACLHTAQKNGHTGEEARLCDDGSVDCPDCPFVRVLTPHEADALPERWEADDEAGRLYLAGVIDSTGRRLC